MRSKLTLVHHSSFILHHFFFYPVYPCLNLPFVPRSLMTVAIPGTPQSADGEPCA
jgi:hypothetical protein